MGRWREFLSRLSAKQATKREAAFEAELLAETGAGSDSVTAKPATPAAPALEVAITVTVDGIPRVYRDLAAVPPAVRQQITDAWRAPPDRPSS
ncbi:hypothetical protein HQ590_08450 [bacterium]|nr:hypothetical protein [bacterium]